MSEWISVEKRMPNKTGNVFVKVSSNEGEWETILNYYICPEYENGLWETIYFEDFEDKVTAWMPF